MTTHVACTECSGDGTQTVLYTGRPFYDEREEPCEACGGTGAAQCDGCGDPASEMYDGLPYCGPCAEGEREWDAAVSATDRALDRFQGAVEGMAGARR